MDATGSLPTPGLAAQADAEVTAAQLVALRRDLLRFARLQLRNAETAEDMVQDAIEAALRNRTGFRGQSSVKTWVFAILRNRIVDHLRQSHRTISLTDAVGDADGWEERLEALFTDRGSWSPGARPRAWRSPDDSLREREFWQVFEACLQVLPAHPARVFMMREFLGFECAEICRLLGITAGNCHVLLHRSRLKLRDCMQRGWGRPEDCAC